MSTVNYSLRIDEADKQSAEDVFRALGMTFSTGINIYIKAVGRARKIPFALDVSGNTAIAPAARTTQSDREKSFKALGGILAGHTVDLEREREERILSK